MKNIYDIEAYLQSKNDIVITAIKDVHEGLPLEQESIIDYNTDIYWGLGMTKDTYDKKEMEINNIKYNHEDYDIYAWCDGSGYNYWVEQQEEDNYITVTVRIKNTTKDWTEEELDCLDKQVFDIIHTLSI